MTADRDVFVENFLRFRLRKPGTWKFIPPQWSPFAQLRNAADPGAEWLRRANAPFCCAMQTHDSPHHAYPTVQVTSRPLAVPTQTVAQMMLEAQIESLRSKYTDFEFIEASTQATIAGCRANFIRATFTVLAQPGEQLIQIPVVSRSYAVFSSTGAFTIGMSSYTDPNYFDEADFRSIIDSVQID